MAIPSVMIAFIMKKGGPESGRCLTWSGRCITGAIFSPPLVDGPVRIGADFGEVWRFGVDEDVRYLLLTQRPEVPTWSLT